MNAVDNAKRSLERNIDWKIVTSTVVAGVVVGVGIWGLKKAGLGKVAAVVKG